MTGYALHKMIGVTNFLLRVLKASAEMMAPAFAAAVEVPWAVAQKRVGNTWRKNASIVWTLGEKRLEHTFGGVTLGKGWIIRIFSSTDIWLTYVGSTKVTILVYCVHD